MSFSEQELIRREKLNHLQSIGIDAYPAPLVPVTHLSVDAKNEYELNNQTAFDVLVAGRIMSMNDKGKVFFIKI